MRLRPAFSGGVALAEHRTHSYAPVGSPALPVVSRPRQEGAEAPARPGTRRQGWPRGQEPCPSLPVTRRRVPLLHAFPLRDHSEPLLPRADSGWPPFASLAPVPSVLRGSFRSRSPRRQMKEKQRRERTHSARMALVSGLVVAAGHRLSAPSSVHATANVEPALRWARPASLGSPYLPKIRRPPPPIWTCTRLPGEDLCQRQAKVGASYKSLLFGEHGMKYNYNLAAPLRKQTSPRSAPPSSGSISGL